VLVLLTGWNWWNWSRYISGISRVPLQRSRSDRRWRFSRAVAAGWQV